MMKKAWCKVPLISCKITFESKALLLYRLKSKLVYSAYLKICYLNIVIVFDFIYPKFSEYSRIDKMQSD